MVQHSPGIVDSVGLKPLVWHCWAIQLMWPLLCSMSQTHLRKTSCLFWSNIGILLMSSVKRRWIPSLCTSLMILKSIWWMVLHLCQVWSNYLSQSELHELCEFLDKHLWIGFICPSHSPHGAPVLFIEKKNGDLCLWVDFHGLNKVTKKDCYPLLLMKDLLEEKLRYIWNLTSTMHTTWSVLLRVMNGKLLSAPTMDPLSGV